jgi:hypothetical protein
MPGVSPGRGRVLGMSGAVTTPPEVPGLELVPADVISSYADRFTLGYQRDQLAGVAARICCTVLVAEWTFGVSAAGVGNPVEHLVETTLDGESTTWPGLLLQRLGELKAHAGRLGGRSDDASSLLPRSEVWRACARYLAASRDDLANVVVFLACALHVEFPEKGAADVLSERRERLVICAAGGCLVPDERHFAVRHAVRVNVAAA